MARAGAERNLEPAELACAHRDPHVIDLPFVFFLLHRHRRDFARDRDVVILQSQDLRRHVETRASFSHRQSLVEPSRAEVRCLKRNRQTEFSSRQIRFCLGDKKKCNQLAREIY